MEKDTQSIIKTPYLHICTDDIRYYGDVFRQLTLIRVPEDPQFATIHCEKCGKITDGMIRVESYHDWFILRKFKRLEQ